jgi:hypothetical protein
MKKIKLFIKNIVWLFNNDLSENNYGIRGIAKANKEAVRIFKRTKRELS